MRNLTLASAVALLLILCGSAGASYPYDSFRVGVTSEVGYSYESSQDGGFLAGRLNFRIKERYTLFLGGGLLGTSESGHEEYWFENGEARSPWHEESEELYGVYVGYRHSWITLMPPTRRTFFRFDPQEIRFKHEPELVGSFRPYVESFLGSAIGAGGGLEWQPVGPWSVEIGLMLLYDLAAEANNFRVIPRFGVSFFI